MHLLCFISCKDVSRFHLLPSVSVTIVFICQCFVVFDCFIYHMTSPLPCLY